MKKLSLILAIIMLITSLVSVNGYAADESSTFRSDRRTEDFLRTFVDSNNTTITISSENSKWMKKSLIKSPIIIEYKDRQVSVHYNYRFGGLKAHSIHIGKDMTMYSPSFPYFYVKQNDIGAINSGLLRFLIFQNAVLVSSYLGSYNETIDGQEYHVEEYRITDKDEEIAKYYFIGDEMVKMAFGFPDSPSTFETYDVEVTYNNVDDACFVVPSTAVINISWLSFLFIKYRR